MIKMRGLRPSLSVQSQLVVAFLVVAIVAAASVLWVLMVTGQGVLRDAAVKQLKSIAAARKQTVENELDDFRKLVKLLATAPATAEALKGFRAGYAKLQRPTSPDAMKKLEDYYREQYGAKLQKFISGGQVSIEPLLPVTDAANYLQYHYLAANPKPFDQKAELDDAGDGSEWSAVHRRVNPLFRRLGESFGYDDILLVDAETNAIVYSALKRPDFGTNLETGPYRESGLARLIRALRADPDRGAILMVDFMRYRPALREPIAFIGAPVYDDKTLLGYVVAGFPAEALRHTLSAGGEWEAQGLGRTGETYLVGADHVFRSESRFMIEDPKGFPDLLARNGAAKETVDNVRRFGTVVMNLGNGSEAVAKALAGEQGVIQGTSYRHVPTLTAYAPVDFAGLRWALLADMDLSEALAARDALLRRVFIVASLLLLAVITIAAWLARRFMQPVQDIAAGAVRVAQGAEGARLPVKGDDEFAELARSFNELATHVEEVRRERDAADRSRNDLLAMFLPAGAAARGASLQAAADRYPAVTVVAARIEGLDGEDGTEALDRAREIIAAFDTAAREQGLDPIQASTSEYLAVAGLSAERLDSTVRAADFALEIQRIAQRFGASPAGPLRVSIGIDAGAAAGGLAGHGRLRYVLAGPAVEGARNAAATAEPGTVRVTAAVRQTVGSAYEFSLPDDASRLSTLTS